MASKRRHKRIIKRLDASFSSGGESFRGTSSNFSESGLFLRTKKPLPADTQVDVTIQLPDNTHSRLRGTVRWVSKSVHSGGRSGMGIEIGEYDRQYVNFLNTLLPSEEQILYKVQKKAVPEIPAAKTEHFGHRKDGPVLSTKNSPAASPAVTREDGRETGDNEIDSLISSLFSRRENKKGE